MDIGTAIVSAILIAMCVVPILLILKSKKKA